jgi:predicted kinase
MDRDLYIVRGVPGSGKSTFAENISRAVCTADDYHTDRAGNYNWKPENVGRAHDWCQRKCARFMKKGISPIAVANTSTTEREFKAYQEMARKKGYRVFSVIVENRHGGVDSHNVPVETLEKMRNRFEVKL